MQAKRFVLWSITIWRQAMMWWFVSPKRPRLESFVRSLIVPLQLQPPIVM